MKIFLLLILTLYLIYEISSYTLSGYKLRNNHLKYYLLNTPKNIDYSITQFIFKNAFKEWSENCNITFEFKEARIPSNLIKQNLKAYGRTKNCSKS